MAPKRRTALEKWGRELGHAIDASEISARQLAQDINVAPSTISNWVGGKRMPDVKDVQRIERALGTNGYLERTLVEWVSEEVPSEWRDKWLAAEKLAHMVFNFELSVVPGLLQTEDYARTVIQYNRHAPFDAEQRVRRRMERQEILTDTNPPTCVFVIDEYVLHRNVGGPKIMAEQLAHLHDLAEQPNVVIKVVPTGTEYYAGCPFMLARLNGKEIANLDDTLTGRVIEGNDDVTEVAKIWEDIREAALPPKESLEVIEKAFESWKHRCGGNRLAAAPTVTNA